jgi:hypothetical protein
VKKILKAYIKFKSSGDKLYEGLEALINNEKGTIATLKKETLLTCQRCGRVVEPHQARTSCEVCGGPCCDTCHEQRVRHEKSIFERLIIVERERLRVLESKIFNGCPGIDTIRQIQGIGSIKRLERASRKASGGVKRK